MTLANFTQASVRKIESYGFKSVCLTLIPPCDRISFSAQIDPLNIPLPEAIKLSIKARETAHRVAEMLSPFIEYDHSPYPSQTYTHTPYASYPSQPLGIKKSDESLGSYHEKDYMVAIGTGEIVIQHYCINGKSRPSMNCLIGLSIGSKILRDQLELIYEWKATQQRNWITLAEKISDRLTKQYSKIKDCSLSSGRVEHSAQGVASIT